MNVFFKELYQYNQLVNEKVIEAIKKEMNRISLRTVETVGHILLAHQTWNLRMQGEKGLADVWHALPVEEWFSLNAENTAVSLDILAQRDLGEMFDYTNTKNVPFSSSYQDVLFHVINHSSYHRGQVNADLRRAGAEPVIADYIFYKR